MSTTTMQEELTLALQFREALLAISPSNHSLELYNAIEPELLKLIYAKNQDLSEIACQKIRTLLLKNLDRTDPSHKQLHQLIKTLLEKRKEYLPTVAKGFFRFWAEEKWAGANFALLGVPLLVGVFFPVVGVGLLVYTSIVAASAATDLARKSSDYWLEASLPDSRELTDNQRQEFTKQYKDIDIFFPENNSKKDTLKFIDRQSYGLYGLTFAIALIGLVSLVFPPIGIPVLALSMLSLIALGATGLQIYLLSEKQSRILEEITHEKTTKPVTTLTDHNSNVLISEKLSEQLTAISDPPETVLSVSSPENAVILASDEQGKYENDGIEEEEEKREGPHY